MDARTHQFMDQLNTHLNTFFTLNYTCLKAGARSNPLTTNVGTDSFGGVWLEEKMQILADQRIAWMTAIRESVFDLDECGFNAAMDTFKVDFMKTFEEVYGPSGTFDDNFDGFKIKHPEFKKDFFNLDFLCKVFITLLHTGP